MELFTKYNSFSWVLAGLLLGVGFVIPTFWIGGILGIVLCVHLVFTTKSLKRLVFGSITAWTIKSALALVWFWSVYPIEWLSFDLGRVQLILIFGYWFTVSLWLGTGGALFALSVRKVSTLINKKYVLFGIPFLWLGSEIFGSYIFSLITIGEGGVITSAFSFGFVGYLLAQHGVLIQLAQFGGVYVLGVGIVFLSVGLYWLWYFYTKNLFVSLGALLILFLTGSIGLFSEISTNNPEQYHVVSIDTSFPTNLVRTTAGQLSIQQELGRAVEEALLLEPDYILLPEDASYFDQIQRPAETKALFRFQYNNPEVVIVDTGRVEIEGKAYLQSYVYNGRENQVDQSQKRYLVPQGEFMPVVYVGVLNFFGLDELTSKIGKDISFQVGERVNQSDFALTTPGVLFCFESVSPWGVRTILQERGEVPFIAHPISHAWFHESDILWQNLDSMLRVQAVWNQEYIVSAGSHVPGQVISPNGNIKSPEIILSGDNWTIRQTYIPKK